MVNRPPSTLIDWPVIFFAISIFGGVLWFGINDVAMKEMAGSDTDCTKALGKLKDGDIPGDVRNEAIEKMVELYFPENTVIISGFGFDMLYAGPREALLHAVFRQNCGCSHLIVGRDHAGVGDY